MPDEPRFRRLLPDPADVLAGPLLDSLELGHRDLAERPFTLVNFIASLDGRATFDGRSQALGDEGDRAIFHGLRERVDAVLAGTNTMSVERYGRIIGKPERRTRRRERGLPAEPLACLVSRSGKVPTEIPLFAEPEARVVIFCATDLRLDGVAATVEVVRLDPAELTLTTTMRRLRSDFGVRTLLCEGGPTLFGALLRERIVDELFLTLAPKLVGGGRGPTVTSGPELPDLQPVDLRWLLERHGSLYLRYGVA